MRTITQVKEVWLDEKGFQVVFYYTNERLHIEGKLVLIELHNEMLRVNYHPTD